MHEQSRHGARAARPSRPLLTLAVLPASLVVVIATATLAYVLSSQGSGHAGHAADGGALWSVLGGAALLAGAVVAGAAVAAAEESGGQAAKLAALCRHAARGRVETQALLRKLERGERLREPDDPPPAEGDQDAFGQLRQEIAASRQAAAVALARAADLAGGRGPLAGEGRTEVFTDLARRMQMSAHRQIEYLEELADEAEDAELLRGLRHLGHLSARIRRHAENLAVLGGSVPRPRWTRPVDACEVLRSCVAEVEHYPRVEIVPPVTGEIRGHAAADVVHLLAELVENATEFSAPQTRVLLRTQPAAAGLAIEVEDRGLGMSAAEQSRMNAVLAGAERTRAEELLAAGRVGLLVVASLAQRHRIAVRLQSNVYGGVQAVVVVPHELLTGDPAGGASAGAGHARDAALAGALADPGPVTGDGRHTVAEPPYR